MLNDLHLYVACPACKRRIRHYVKGLSLHNSRTCPRCGVAVETTMNAVVKALLKLESADGGLRPGR